MYIIVIIRSARTLPNYIYMMYILYCNPAELYIIIYIIYILYNIILQPPGIIFPGLYLIIIILSELSLIYYNGL